MRVLAPLLPGLVTAPKSRPCVAWSVTGARIVTLTLAVAVTVPADAGVADILRAAARASKRAFCAFMRRT